ncbi:beta-galactosidase [Brachybacterium sp. P6-10-X1]|uniref:beta-galactosidase n=1 Tax=Brachybacterium sp. P6-10-X1 TaxID=1903186 RepID=UPI0009718443|nr:beta-galactosidase [Brachybacterium sp. P6-10-X1]APX33877.1 beta-galactosidase [Brachybacterium sp. P6-10-X1]
MPAARPWPLGVDGIAYGGDYNPEQWPREVRLEDVELMREAGVTLVSVAIFAWATLEPREGEYDLAWLDEVMDSLGEAGIKVALATATASPPPWLTRHHPEILPVTEDGTTLGPGGRQAYAVSSPLFREYALRMTRMMAERYGDHPALALWHVDNELGCHVPHDYSEHAAVAFRGWLERRYGTVERLNEAWGTAFWSQRYDSFHEILPPRAAPTDPNPTQQLDFARYSSDELLAHYRALRGVLREVTPQIPATTNVMLSSATKWMDYFSWAGDVDVVANDHYLIAADPRGQIELALAADLSRGVAGGDPWILMEHSTSAVNWQARNRAKGPAEMLRNSLSHVARGADGIMFFQWRQSRAGAEKFHSAMLPHAGQESEVWRSTVALGRALEALAPVHGSRVLNRVAIVMDYPSWWGSELDSHPTQALRYSEELLRWYTALWDLGVGVDLVPTGTDLTGYDLVVAPTLYTVSDEDAERLAEAARAGTQVVITFFSGIVDENDHVRLGGYPGAFRELLGVRSEEFHPLVEGEIRHLDDGTAADLWSEKTHLEGAEAVRTWADGPLHGWPAVTRQVVGDGAGWYVAARPSADGLETLLGEIVAAAGVEPTVPGLHRDVEAVRRFAEDGITYLFVLNHSEGDQVVQVSGYEMLSGADAEGALTVPAGSAAVIQES